MIPLLQTRQTKPNRIETPEDSKGDQYHLEYGRWVLGSSSNVNSTTFDNKYKINREFYKNNQWIHSEDTEAFFMDESGQDRHRLKVTKNYIQPMVEQYRGNAERMRFDHKIHNISPLAKSRRDKMLARLLNYQKAGANNPGYQDYLRQQGIPVGSSEDETTAKFDNSYTDDFVIAGNRMLRSVVEINDLMSLKTKLAMDIALGGIAAIFPYPHGGDWRFRRVVPNQFGFDTTAQSETLKDAEFFWEADLMSPTTIYEQWQGLSNTDRAAIESYVANNSANTYVSEQPNVSQNGKITVYTTIWRDILVDNFGYVKDEFGQIILARLDYIEPLQEKPKYTSKDLVKYESLTPYQKRVMMGNTTRKLYVDNWRFATFIPSEVVGINTQGNKGRDIILDKGVLPYQEPDLYRPTNMMPPYKVGIWSYIDGEILSPVDVAINPQRMINRFMSVMENQINNATGASTIYDKDALGTDDEDELLVKMKRSEPVGIHARGRGVQNYIGRYDGMPKESLIAFNGLVETFKQGMEDTTGVNEGLKGQTNNPDQLVGVMQLMIQRGSIIQEPFYKALSDVYKGCYQNILSSARRFYIDNRLDLEDFVGVDGAEVIRLSEAMRSENLRVDLERSVDPQTERVYVDQQIMMWLQFGMIDQPTAASLTGKATYAEAVSEMRNFQKGLMVRQRMADQQNQALAAQVDNANTQMDRVAMGEGLRQEAREDINKQLDRETKLEVASNKTAP